MSKKRTEKALVKLVINSLTEEPRRWTVNKYTNKAISDFGITIRWSDATFLGAPKRFYVELDNSTGFDLVQWSWFKRVELQAALLSHSANLMDYNTKETLSKAASRLVKGEINVQARTDCC